MVENPEGRSAANHEEKGDYGPRAPTQPENISRQSDTHAPTSNGGNAGRNDGEPPSRSFRTRLTINEWLTFSVAFATFLVGTGGLIVSYFTYRNATDTSDLKTAVGNLTTLAVETRRQADVSENAQRAWLAVVKIVLADLNNLNDPLKMKIFVQNVGREPAQAVKNRMGIAYIRDIRVPATQWQNLTNWKTESAWQPKSICATVADSPVESVSYPSGIFGFWIDVTKDSGPNIPDSMIPILFEEIKAMKTILVVKGCFSYETTQRTRFSSFCALLNPSAGGKDITEWTFSGCPVGNHDW